jgi:ribonuclease P protein component
VGPAVRRNRVKRLLRESIRLMGHDLPGGFDLIIVVRPHMPMKLAEYQHFLALLVGATHGHWTRESPKNP